MSLQLFGKNRKSPPWSLVDGIALSTLVVIATALRFWRLGTPAEIVYDEGTVVNQAEAFMAGRIPRLSTHPPVGKLLVALSIWLFGDYPWGWRALNAFVGTALVAGTYLLGRKLFSSRLAASLAGGIILCDGMFLVASRLAMINIVYITLTAWAYLTLFRFIDNSEPRARRRTLVAMSVLLGLCVGTKAVISEVAALIAVASVVFTLVSEGCAANSGDSKRLVLARIVCACALIGGIILIVYVASFWPFYWNGWWGGIGDLVRYHRSVLSANLEQPSTRPDSSPFWSWPLLLRPYAYWMRVSPAQTVAVIWCGGNPLLWWGILASVPMAISRGYRERSFAWTFLAAAYAMNLAMWIPIRRYVFIYDYIPAAYLGLLALAGALAECWNSNAPRWEQFALLAALVPCLTLAFGTLKGGAIASAVVLAHLLIMEYRENLASRFVCVIFVTAAVAVFIYFFPFWTGIPLTEKDYAARIWFNGKGLANWK